MATLQNLGHGINRLSNVFSPDDCRRFIALAEGFGFQPATINTLTGVKLESEVRNNDRVIFDSAELAQEVWQRVALDLPPVWMGRGLAGLNERFRLPLCPEPEVRLACGRPLRAQQRRAQPADPPHLSRR